jgi:zinc transport system permease protein
MALYLSAAGTAGYFSRSLAGMMLLSCIFSALFSAGGLILGWSFDLPVGAMVVILAGTVFLAAGAVPGG